MRRSEVELAVLADFDAAGGAAGLRVLLIGVTRHVDEEVRDDLDRQRAGVPRLYRQLLAVGTFVVRDAPVGEAGGLRRTAPGRPTLFDRCRARWRSSRTTRWCHPRPRFPGRTPTVQASPHSPLGTPCASCGSAGLRRVRRAAAPAREHRRALQAIGPPTGYPPSAAAQRSRLVRGRRRAVPSQRSGIPVAPRVTTDARVPASSNSRASSRSSDRLRIAAPHNIRGGAPNLRLPPGACHLSRGEN